MGVYWYSYITAVSVERSGAKSVIADDVEIEFDEEISEPY